MAVAPLYLADKSALARLHHPTVARRMGPLLVDGLVATTPIVDLAVLYSARSPADYEDVLAERRALPSFPLTPEVTDRAVDVQRRLAQEGRHRLPLPDLLIAATAELNGLAVLHYDADYDRIAEVTGQRCEWVAPRGSL
ncbi:MAG: PIN domain nuclease [Acidimicrobiia bacterium]|nr:PIN domain nuclease [Acidimicrobiia bacterium]MYC45946.1 PIN domain nuclease [Acidimicrobiia bacterium]